MEVLRETLSSGEGQDEEEEQMEQPGLMLLQFDNRAQPDNDLNEPDKKEDEQEQSESEEEEQLADPLTAVPFYVPEEYSFSGPEYKPCSEEVVEDRWLGL
jgi:hypothetical protein